MRKKGSNPFVFFVAFFLLILIGFLNPQSSNASIEKVAALLPTTPKATTTQAPQSEVRELADKATMTQEAKQIFYAAQPEIDTSRTEFEKHCQTPGSTQTIELGCYTSDNRIYILNITDPKLKDEMVATVSHEMLHAAYLKLSDKEKADIDRLLEAQVPNLSNTNLPQELQNYRMTEPGERDNELHSLLGTEYSPLSPQLESYYNRYFTNRQEVANSYQSFNGVFENLQTKLTDLETRIKNVHVTMLADLRSGKISEYNALVSEENDLIHQYDNGVVQYNQLSLSLLGGETPLQSQ